MRHRCNGQPRSRTGLCGSSVVIRFICKLLHRLHLMGNACCGGFKSQSTADTKGVRPSTERHVFYDNHVCPNREYSPKWVSASESPVGLQHIREREHDDVDQDPSTHPTKGPMFVERSRSEMKLRENRRSCYFTENQSSVTNLPLRKYNSCSTIFLDESTVSQPHLKNTVKCISLAIYYHICNRRYREVDQSMDIFNEYTHPIMPQRMPMDYFLRNPDQRSIYRFVRMLFAAAQLTAECAIVTLVYVERLLLYGEIDLCPFNWRRIVLGAIMLASKVWDDQAVWNVDYCQILQSCTVDDINELERHFLECLEFNINVPSSVYAKYYFDLRELAIGHDLQLPLQPLSKERAKRLEALSRLCEDKLVEEQKKVHRRWNSADRLANGLRALAIIS